jgi:hypothetical protein
LGISWSHPPTGADVLGLGKQGRRARLVHLFTPHPIAIQFGGHDLEHVAIFKVRTGDDERRQTKRNNIADMLMVEVEALADRKIERAAVESERHIVEADLGPVRDLATLTAADDETLLRCSFVIAVPVDRPPLFSCGDADESAVERGEPVGP